MSQMGTANLITDNGMSMKCFCTHSSGQCAASNPGNLSSATLGWEESEDGKSPKLRLGESVCVTGRLGKC